MAYAAWSVSFGEQPSASKWNILGTNDAHFYTYAGDGTNAVQQVQHQSYTAQSTGTTIMPRDNTIPQNTEGDQYMSLAITPKSATNKLKIEVVCLLSNSNASQSLTAALFQDTTANALAVGTAFEASATGMNTISYSYYMTSGTVSATTFKVRGGSQTAGTTTFNGGAGVGADLYGATVKSSITITEYKV